jgi:sarcosine oxidase subunit delta
MPDPASCSDGEWADYVFNRNGAPGVKREWWLHLPSGVWFIAERDTAIDRVLRTFMYGDEAQQ